MHLLILLTSINMVNYLDRYVVAALLEPLGRDLKMTDAELGNLNFVFIIVYMCAAPLFGWMADRYHRPRLVAAGVALWSLATMAAALVDSYAMLLVTRSLVGIGEAAYASLGPAMMADSFAEKDRARKFTWFFLAIPVGSALGYGLGGVVAQAFGWRAAFLVAGAPGLLLAAWMAFQSDPVRGAFDTLRDVVARARFGVRMRALFTNRVWLMCTFSYVAYTFAMGALSHWAPTLLQRRFGIETGEAGMVFGGLAVVTGILGTLAGGYATDRLQRRNADAGLWLSGISLLIAAPAVAFALLSGNLYLTYALFFLGMLMLFVNTSPVNALTVSSLPASLRGTGVALNVLLIHLLGDAISPRWVGYRSDDLAAGGATGGDALAQALMITVPAVLLSGVLLWWARRAPAATAATAAT